MFTRRNKAMIQLIVGEKGQGKTKFLLEKVAAAAADAKGNVVFIDNDLSHMYEIKNTVRLVNVSDYYISNAQEFYGFISGLMSADHDLEQLFVDKLLIISSLKQSQDAVELIRKLDKVSSKRDVTLTLSFTGKKEELPEDLQEKVLDFA